MCDQVMALISPEHAQSIAWNEQECDDAIMNINEDQDESSRMFTFEVTKTNEREEAVKSRPGFMVCQTYQRHRLKTEFACRLHPSI